MDIFARWAASCSSLDVLSVAQDAVDGALGRAAELIAADPRGLFLYPLPSEAVEEDDAQNVDDTQEANKEANKEANQEPSEESTEEDSEQPPRLEPPPEPIRWPRIENFDLGDALDAIRAFIGRWRLGPGTRVVLESGGEEEDAADLGTHHHVNALFSRPTPACPNPLAVAIVHFAVHVSRCLPPRHPVMVTYRFEGHRTVYYALGRRCVRSVTFQRFFVETILRTKLAFYAEVCECAHPPRPTVEQEPSPDDAEEEAEATTTAEEEQQDTSGQRSKRDTLRQSHAPIAVGSAVLI